MGQYSLTEEQKKSLEEYGKNKDIFFKALIDEHEIIKKDLELKKYDNNTTNKNMQQ